MIFNIVFSGDIQILVQVSLLIIVYLFYVGGCVNHLCYVQKLTFGTLVLEYVCSCDEQWRQRQVIFVQHIRRIDVRVTP